MRLCVKLECYRKRMEVLKEIADEREWSSGGYNDRSHDMCYLCHNTYRKGHAKDCPYTRLAELDKEHAT